MKQLSYIVVEGPIGVGKTSLAKRLADTFDTRLLLEGAHENPFLERFYQDQRNGALPTQLFFLFQRARQMEELMQGELFSSIRVADFLMEKDRLFAELTLDKEELALYHQVYNRLVIRSPVPDLVIYLQAPLHVLQERIAQRGIGYEQEIQSDYLQRVAEAYTHLFYNYDAAPLLIVNAQHIDFVNNDDDYALLLNKVRSIRHGRHFFNPGIGES
ncbi:MAG: deoxynucleoside kinase [Gammaproteobacteria bacterium]|nr:MAG: deoxynucleoside kinase [Gammaproteobacteria bacterium]